MLSKQIKSNKKKIKNQTLDKVNNKLWCQNNLVWTYVYCQIETKVTDKIWNAPIDQIRNQAMSWI